MGLEGTQLILTIVGACVGGVVVFSLALWLGWWLRKRHLHRQSYLRAAGTSIFSDRDLERQPLNAGALSDTGAISGSESSRGANKRKFIVREPISDAVSAGFASSASSKDSKYLAKIPTKDVRAALKEPTAVSVQFFLRDKAMRVEEALPHVGTRHDKFYYKVISASDSAAILILEATRVPAASPAQHLQEATLGSHAYRRMLMRMVSNSHERLLPIVEADFLSDRSLAISIRPFCKTGSLRDLIFRCKPLNPASKKYSRSGRKFDDQKIARYGRQILDGMLHLRHVGIPFAHLSSGNVLIDEASKKCLLTDWDLIFLAQPPLHVRWMYELRDRVEPDAVAFGCVLYEMAYGTFLSPSFEQPLDSFYPSADTSASPVVREIIARTIFPPKKESGLSLLDLVQLPFFADAPGLQSASGSLKSLDERSRQLISLSTKYLTALISKPPGSASTASLAVSITRPSSQAAASLPRSFSNAQRSALGTSVSSSLAPVSSIPSSKTVASSSITPSPAVPSSSSSSSSIVAPPPSPPPPPPPPPPADIPAAVKAPERGAVLSDIRSFSKNSLKKRAPSR